MRTIEEILRSSRVIAVVGLSDRPERPSYGVAAYLQSRGYRIIPVNPRLFGPVLNEQPYPDLESVSEKVDLVDIFRRSNEVLPVVESSISIGAPAVWLQLGVVNELVAAAARDAGLDVIMDRCIAIEHRVLVAAGVFPR